MSRWISCVRPDWRPSAASRRVRAFWGESVTESKRGQTASQARDGLGHYGYNRALPQARVTKLSPRPVTETDLAHLFERLGLA